MARSILTQDNGRIVTIFNGEAPNENHNWIEISEEDYIRPSPPEDHTVKTYLKEETDVTEFDEETDVIGVVFEEQETEE